MKRCLVTGATGFIGSYLVRFLMEQGLVVYGAVHHNHHPPIPLPEAATLMPCDITDRAQVVELVGRSAPDYLFHLAAQTNISLSWQDPSTTFQANVLGTIHLLDALSPATGGGPVVVNAGSSAEYGPLRPEELPVTEGHPLRPSTPYGVSKVAQESLAFAYHRAYDLNVTSVRPFHITGPGKGDACNDFARQVLEIERGKRDCLRVGNLEAVRDLVDVRDAVRALWLVAQKGEAGEAYNLCSGQGHHIRELLEGLVSLAPVPVRVEPDPDRLRPADDPVLVGDNSRLRALGWQPQIHLERTLSDVLGYWRA